MSVQEKAALVQGTGRNLVVKVRGADRFVTLIKTKLIRLHQYFAISLYYFVV